VPAMERTLDTQVLFRGGVRHFNDEQRVGRSGVR
jgi:hypothetical protein